MPRGDTKTAQSHTRVVSRRVLTPDRGSNSNSKKAAMAHGETKAAQCCTRAIARRVPAPNPLQEEDRVRRRGMPGRMCGPQSQGGLSGRNDKGVHSVNMSIHLFNTDRTVEDGWSEAQGEDDRSRDTWPAPPESVANLPRPQSPTSVVEHNWVDHNDGEKEKVQACTMRAVGIDQGMTVILCRMTVTGVMADSGANTCMADSEVYLLGFHNICTVTVGSAIAAHTDPTMHTCNRMGCVLFT